jgi:hypothetical protein
MKLMEFDLKGSLCSRRTKIKNDDDTKNKTLKDINLIEMQKKSQQSIIKISNDEKLELQKIIRADSNFLTKMGLMDYSLLL